MALFGRKDKRIAKHAQDKTGRGAVVAKVLLVLLAVIVCVVPAVFVASPIAYIPAVSVVLIIIISYVYLRILVWALEFSEDSLLGSCERGTQIEFVVNFKNKSPLVFVRLEPYFYIGDLFGEVDALIPTSMVLMPFEDRDFRFDAQFDHIGTYSAGVKKIVISDLLGLFTHTIDNAKRHEVKVLPRLFHLANVQLSNVSVKESRKAFRPVVTDDLDYAGVREYEPGDPLKTIHWKLSSRNPEENYFTRLFETFGNPGVSVIIDSYAPDYDNESLMQVFDGVVESALSINDFACKHGVDSELVYLDANQQATKLRLLNIQQADSLMNSMMRIQAGEGQASREMLVDYGTSMYAQGNIVFCTAHVNDAIVSTLLEIKLRQRAALLFVAVPSFMDREQQREFLRPLRRLEAANVPYVVVCSAQNKVEEVL